MELIVVVFIMLILTAVAMGNYRPGGQQLALERSAFKLAQDIRRVQEMAMSSRVESECGADFQGGYGIYFHATASEGPTKPGPNAYFLFADCNNDEEFDATDHFDKIKLESEILFKRAYFASGDNPHATIIFYPPDPSVIIKSDSGTQEWVEIQLDIRGQEKIIYINEEGLIYVK